MVSSTSSSPAAAPTTSKRRRQSAGRQRIEIRLIESESAKQVCFAKRRAGVFRKASELSTLCGAHVAAVVFSPAGKPFCFGSPSVESVISRFLSGDAGAGADTGDAVVSTACGVHELKRRHEVAVARVEAERARAGAMEAAVERARGGREFWWEADVEELGIEELSKFEKALVRLRENVARRAGVMLEDAVSRQYQDWLSSS